MNNTDLYNVDCEPGVPCHHKTFFSFTVHAKEIFNIKNSLEKKARWDVIDVISNKLSKLVASAVSYHVAQLINRSIQEGLFLFALKQRW